MNYLNKQLSNQQVELTATMMFIVDYFEQHQNVKVQIDDLVEVSNQFNFQQIYHEITKLVSRNLVQEYYIDDLHYFEFTTSCEVENKYLFDEIIDTLKEKNYRITDSRKRLVEIFTTDPFRHFTFDELVNLSGEKVNIATMYNNISTLLDEKIIAEFYVGDIRIFELGNRNHAHFICEECKKAINIDTKMSNAINDEVEEQYGYIVNNTKVEFTGICTDCQSNDQITNVTVINEHQYENIDEEQITDYLGYLQKKTKKNNGQITIVMLNEEEIQVINNEFRQIDRPTDVLSFTNTEDDYLGDILICYDIVKRQAQEYNHSFKRELFFLITHGFLHLLGYDHMEPNDEKEMFELQKELLNKYGVSRYE